MFKRENNNNPLNSHLHQHCRCLYLTFISDILRLLASFIWDLVPKAATGLAINSSSDLLLPVKMRPGTSTILGRKKLLLWLSGSCISFWIESLCVCICVCVCACVFPMRRRGHLIHVIMLDWDSQHQRGTEQERQKNDMSHCPPGLLRTGKHCEWSHKNVFGTFCEKLQHSESSEVYMACRFLQLKKKQCHQSPWLPPNMTHIETSSI